MTAAVLAYEKQAHEIGLVCAELGEVEYLLSTPGYWKCFDPKARRRGRAIHRRLRKAATLWLAVTRKLYLKRDANHG
jgi:hypothetical protein